MTDTPMLGSKEAAAVLGISRSRLQRLVRDGSIKPVHQGEGVRGPFTFTREEIDRYGDPATRRADSTGDKPSA